MHRSNYECYPNPDGTRGWAWNPITGSLGDCPNPNARKLANTRLRHIYMSDESSDKFITVEPHSPLNMPDPFYPRFWPERLEDAWDIYGGKPPRGIFVCDMSDLFGVGIPEKWTGDVLDVIRFNKRDRFYLLTKQPQNLAKFSPFPDHCYVGVSATDDKSWLEAVHYLTNFVEAKVKFVSFEPLLGHISTGEMGMFTSLISSVDWLIIGSQTCKSYWELVAMYPDDTERIMKYGKSWTFQPKIEWVQEIVEAADKAGIPVFLKKNLEPLILKEEKLPIWAMRNWQRGKRFELRQEFPK